MEGGKVSRVNFVAAVHVSGAEECLLAFSQDARLVSARVRALPLNEYGDVMKC